MRSIATIVVVLSMAVVLFIPNVDDDDPDGLLLATVAEHTTRASANSVTHSLGISQATSSRVSFSSTARSASQYVRRC